MSGGKKAPNGEQVAFAQEWVIDHPELTISDDKKSVVYKTWQDVLAGWGFKNDTGQAPDFTPSLPKPDDIKPLPSGEDQISKDVPKHPTLLTVEPFDSWSFMEIYNAMKDASSTPTYLGGRGNLGDAWRAVNQKISVDRNTYDDAINHAENQGGWTGKTHDAVWQNVQKYLPEIDNMYHAVDALAIMFDTFERTIFQTRWFLETYKQAYDKDMAAFHHFADRIEQNYSGVAQQVMAKVYVPGIQFIRDNNPAFSGQTPSLTNPAPATTKDGGTPPPAPPPPPDLSKGLNDLAGKGGAPPPPGLGGLTPPGLGDPNLAGAHGSAPPLPPGLGGLTPPGLGDPNLAGAHGSAPPLPPGLGGLTPPGLGDPNLAGAHGSAPPLPPGLGGLTPPGLGDPNFPGSNALAPPPPPNLSQLSGGGAGSPLSGLSGLSGVADSAKSLASNPGAGGGPGSAADAVKQAMNAAGKGPGGAPEGLGGLGAKSPHGLSGPIGSTGGVSGLAGVGPGLSGPAGVPVAAAAKELALSGSGLQGGNAALGAQAGGGSGGGSPGGGGPGGGQRGQNEKEHKGNKALRTKVNGEWVIGEVNAVVPVIGDDAPDQHEAAQPSARTPLPADRHSRHDQRDEPKIVPPTDPVRRTAGI
jgi:hypothetical protein